MYSYYKPILFVSFLNNNENIYFVFTSDNNNQSKNQAKLHNLNNLQVLKRHVNKLQHKSKTLKLTYRAVFK